MEKEIKSEIKKSQCSESEQKERSSEKPKPASPSHPKKLYGSATAMTTNWDW